MTKVTGSGSTTITEQGKPKSSVTIKLKPAQKSTVDTSSPPPASELIKQINNQTTPQTETVREKHENLETHIPTPPPMPPKPQMMMPLQIQRNLPMTEIGGKSISEDKALLPTRTEEEIFGKNNIPTPPPMPAKPQMMTPDEVMASNAKPQMMQSKPPQSDVQQTQPKTLSVFGKMKQKISNAFKKRIASGLQVAGRAFQVCGQKMTNIGNAIERNITNGNLQGAKQNTSTLGKLFQGAKNLASFTWQKVKGAGEKAGSAITSGMEKAKTGLKTLGGILDKGYKQAKILGSKLKDIFKSTKTPEMEDPLLRTQEESLENKELEPIKALVQKLTETTEKLQKNTELSPDKTKELESDLSNVVQGFEKKKRDNANINPDTLNDLHSGLENILKKLQDIKTPQQPDTTKTEESEAKTKTEETKDTQTDKLKTDDKEGTSKSFSSISDLFNKIIQLLKPKTDNKIETTTQDTQTKEPTPKNDLMETLQDLLKQITDIVKTIEKFVPQKIEPEKAS